MCAKGAKKPYTQADKVVVDIECALYIAINLNIRFYQIWLACTQPIFSRQTLVGRFTNFVLLYQ